MSLLWSSFYLPGSGTGQLYIILICLPQLFRCLIILMGFLVSGLLRLTYSGFTWTTSSESESEFESWAWAMSSPPENRMEPTLLVFYYLCQHLRCPGYIGTVVLVMLLIWVVAWLLRILTFCNIYNCSYFFKTLCCSEAPVEMSSHINWVNHSFFLLDRGQDYYFAFIL